MTSPTPHRQSSPRCHECGVLLDLSAKPCWMCGADQPVLATLASAEGSPSKKSNQDLWLHLSFWMLLLLAVMVAYGVLFAHHNDRIIQITYALAFLPPLVIGMSVAAYYRVQERPLGWMNKTILLAFIVAVSFPLAGIVFIYMVVIAIMQTCFPSR